MFEKREIVAMSLGYGITVPIAVAAIYLGAPAIIAVPLFLIGFLVTLVKLNWN